MWCAALAFALLCAAPAAAQELPSPAGFVNDFAGVISADEERSITGIIETLEQKTTVEIVVVTVRSTAPLDDVSY